MILWDRVKRNLDRGVETVRRFSVSLSERARIESAVARLMIDKGSLETRLDRLCRELGGRVYELHETGRDPAHGDGEAQDKMREIAACRDEIAGLKQKIQKVSLGEEAD